MLKGFFIIFEGGEGSGKSTQADLLVRNLRRKGLEVVKTTEPGGIPVGEKIRKILLDTKNTHLTAKTEFFLFLANRSQHVKDLIKPALKQGKIVVCDRFSGSTFAYQHFARGLPRLTELKKMNKFACDSLEPNLVVLLDINPKEGLKRKGENLSRFDQESLDFHQKVRQGYLHLAKTEPHWVVLNGSKSLCDLEKEILDKVLERLKEHRH